MAYSAALNTVYNYYLTTYTKGTSQYDTHKKSELRGICNAIVKMNREAPLSIFDTTKDTWEFAVSVKENARDLYHTVLSLGGLDENTLFDKKIAYSSNEAFVSAEYIGGHLPDSPVPSFTIEVESLASPQINIGRYLPDEPAALSSGTYSFDLNVGDLNYEFQFAIHENESNPSLQNRLMRLINNSAVGITSDLLTDSNGLSALRISSVSTGLSDAKSCLFSISDSNTSKRSGAVDYLGINYMARNASNSSFLLNGERKSSTSNSFTIEKTYQVTLNNVREFKGESATIGLKTDVESLTDNISTLVDAYNSFVEVTSSFFDKQPKSLRLVSEMKGVSSLYANELDALGITLTENGTLQIDQDILSQSALEENAKENFHSIREFANALVRKTKQISLDPMHYAASKVVSYKNPGKNFNPPYILSAYSGMFFNSYC